MCNLAIHRGIKAGMKMDMSLPERVDRIEAMVMKIAFDLEIEKEKIDKILGENRRTKKPLKGKKMLEKIKTIIITILVTALLLTGGLKLYKHSNPPLKQATKSVLPDYRKFIDLEIKSAKTQIKTIA
jgi:hypothetical protein